ncbi:hypothetical protein, partial [Helicobacter sp. T3_23-1059]
AIGEHIGNPNSYDLLLDALKNKADNLIDSKDSVREVFIHTPRLEIQKNERIQLLGFSIFSQENCRFRFGQEVAKIDYETPEILEKKSQLESTRKAIELATAQINQNKTALATSADEKEKTKIQASITTLETQKTTKQNLAKTQENELKTLIATRNETAIQNGEIVQGKTMIYSQENEGYQHILFEAKNELGEWVSDIVRLEIRDI